jgi:hypothetical protein
LDGIALACFNPWMLEQGFWNLQINDNDVVVCFEQALNDKLTNKTTAKCHN